jgi:hypothetical protein
MLLLTVHKLTDFLHYIFWGTCNVHDLPLCIYFLSFIFGVVFYFQGFCLAPRQYWLCIDLFGYLRASACKIWLLCPRLLKSDYLISGKHLLLLSPLLSALTIYQGMLMRLTWKRYSVSLLSCALFCWKFSVMIKLYWIMAWTIN